MVCQDEHGFSGRVSILIDEITDDLILLISDFCEEGDEDENNMYWENLIENLQIKLGAA